MQCTCGMPLLRGSPIDIVCMFFSRYLGACRRRTPRTRVDLNVPKGASCRDLSDATLRFDLNPRRSPSACPEKLLKIDPHGTRLGVCRACIPNTCSMHAGISASGTRRKCIIHPTIYIHAACMHRTCGTHPAHMRHACYMHALCMIRTPGT